MTSRSFRLSRQPVWLFRIVSGINGSRCREIRGLSFIPHKPGERYAQQSQTLVIFSASTADTELSLGEQSRKASSGSRKGSDWLGWADRSPRAERAQVSLNWSSLGRSRVAGHGRIR